MNLLKLVFLKTRQSCNLLRPGSTGAAAPTQTSGPRHLALLLGAWIALFATPASATIYNFASLRAELTQSVRAEISRQTNAPSHQDFQKTAAAFFLLTATGQASALSTLNDRLTDMIMADALVGDRLRDQIGVDVSKWQALNSDPVFQALRVTAQRMVVARLQEFEKDFPNGEETTRFARTTCEDVDLHGGLTEFASYDAETQTIEYCRRFLPEKGDLKAWEMTLTPTTLPPGTSVATSREPASVDQNDFAIAVAPDENIASNPDIPKDTKIGTGRDSQDLKNLNDLVGKTSGASADATAASADNGRNPASLTPAEKLRAAKRKRRGLPAQSNASVSTTAANATPVHRGVHVTSSSSIGTASMGASMSTNQTQTVIRKSRLPLDVREGFEYRLQYGQLISTFWVVKRGTHFDLLYANSAGSRTSMTIPVESFSYLQSNAEGVHSDFTDISKCPTAKMQIHVLSDGQPERSIAACVQSKNKAANDLRSMGNLLSTIVR